MTETPLHQVAHTVTQATTVSTWLNHWSLLHADWDALLRTNFIGIDGTLLQVVLRAFGMKVARSSADLVLPIAIDEVLASEDRIALVGAAPGVAAKAAARLAPREVLAIDGYAELAELRANPQPLVDFDPRHVIVGLGAGLQEQVACELSQVLPRASVSTAGGWIDQFAAKQQYFPPWVHRLRLGWAWRIVKEPRRLLGRYTVEAVVFLVKAPSLAARLRALPRSSTGFRPTAITQ